MDYDIFNDDVMDSVAFDTQVLRLLCNRLRGHYNIAVLGCWWEGI